MPNQPDKPTIFPGQNLDLGVPTGNTTPPERGLTRRSRKPQGGFPPLPQKDLAKGPSVTISDDELRQIPASFVSVGEDGVPRTYRSIAEIVRKRNGTTVTIKRSRRTPEVNAGGSTGPGKPAETGMSSGKGNEEIVPVLKTVETDAPVPPDPPETAETLPSFDVFGKGRPYPGLGRRRRLMPDEIAVVPPSLTVARGKHVLGFVDAVGKNPRQNPFMPKEAIPTIPTPAEDRTKSSEKNPKPISGFTKIPDVLDGVFLRIMFHVGIRNPDLHLISPRKEPVLIPGAQSRQNKLRDIVAEINTSRESPDKIIELYFRAISEIHPSTDPDIRHEQPPLTQRQINLILKDPIGIIAADILQTALHSRIKVPQMMPGVKKRLTKLREEYDAITSSPRNH